MIQTNQSGTNKLRGSEAGQWSIKTCSGDKHVLNHVFFTSFFHRFNNCASGTLAQLSLEVMLWRVALLSTEMPLGFLVSFLFTLVSLLRILLLPFLGKWDQLRWPSCLMHRGVVVVVFFSLFSWKRRSTDCGHGAHQIEWVCMGRSHRCYRYITHG